MSKNAVELGDKVRDKVGGFTGIVVCIGKYLTGCDRVTVQGEVGKDGKLGEAYSFDTFAVEIVKKGAVKIESPGVNYNGGPPFRVMNRTTPRRV